MHVCYMRNLIKAPKFARLLSKTSKYYDIELVYCRPTDVDMEKEIIHGKVLKNNKWVRKDVSIPPYIDINSYCFKHKEVIDFLKKKSVLSCSGKFGSKEKVYDKLYEDGEFKHLIIPTKRLKSFSEFVTFLKDYQKVIIKPANGHKGKGVYLVTAEQSSYKVFFENIEKKLDTISELQEFLESNMNLQSQVFQKYIESRTKSGDPFDCRIRMEKNGKGRWESVINLVRVGANQKVVSNVAQGGSVASLTPFLKANYPQRWESIQEEIIAIGQYLPYKMETLFHNPCTSMGIDIGFDEQGSVFLFEVNSAPGVEFGEGAIATVKPDYYHYILNKLTDTKNKNIIKPTNILKNLKSKVD